MVCAIWFCDKQFLRHESGRSIKAAMASLFIAKTASASRSVRGPVDSLVAPRSLTPQVLQTPETASASGRAAFVRQLQPPDRCFLAPHGHRVGIAGRAPSEARSVVRGWLRHAHALPQRFCAQSWVVRRVITLPDGIMLDAENVVKQRLHRHLFCAGGTCRWVRAISTAERSTERVACVAEKVFFSV